MVDGSISREADAERVLGWQHNQNNRDGRMKNLGDTDEACR